jgi:hypothetical protein
MAAACLDAGFGGAGVEVAGAGVDSINWDDGVKVVVDDVSSIKGCVVDGVSGWASLGGAASTLSPAACACCVGCMVGSSTASSDAFGAFRALRVLADLAGQGVLGSENHGNYLGQSCSFLHP